MIEALVNQILPLHLMSIHQEGRIVEVQGAAGFAVRLEEMGFRRGATVRMLRPGCPCIVALEEHRMTFRCDDDALVLVEVAASSAALDVV